MYIQHSLCTAITLHTCAASFRVSHNPMQHRRRGRGGCQGGSPAAMQRHQSAPALAPYCPNGLASRPASPLPRQHLRQGMEYLRLQSVQCDRRAPSRVSGRLPKIACAMLCKLPNRLGPAAEANQPVSVAYLRGGALCFPFCTPPGTRPWPLLALTARFESRSSSNTTAVRHMRRLDGGNGNREFVYVLLRSLVASCLLLAVPSLSLLVAVAAASS